MTNANETVREVCAEIKKDTIGLLGFESKPYAELVYPFSLMATAMEMIAERIEAAYEREIAAKDAEIEAALKKQNDYHAALLTICTADKDAEGLREIAIDVCNGKEN